MILLGVPLLSRWLGPVRRTFRSKTAKQRQQLAGTVYMRKEELHAKAPFRPCLKIFLGRASRSLLTQYGPYFLYLPWAPTILLAAL